MKIALRSERATDTCTHSLSSLHNCPSCKCSNHTIFNNVPRSPHYFHKISDNRTRQNNLYNSHCSIPGVLPANGNIYVCKTTDLAPVHDRSMNQLFRSTMFQSRKNDNSQSKLLSRANITFTYISPKKDKQHRSTDAKFSTKLFKQKHFPFLQSHEQSVEVKQQSNKIKDNPYYTTYTKQSPPKKHKVLRMDKSKSKNKLKTISSNLSEKELTLKQSVKEETPRQRQVLQYEVDYPRVTPINALWEKINQSPSSSLKNVVQAMKKQQPTIHRPSIQHMDLEKQSSQEQVFTPKESTKKIVDTNLIYDKPLPLNSVQSLVNPQVDMINITKTSNSKNPHQEISHYQIEEKSQFWKEKSIKLSQQIAIKGLEELSQQLSQELQLNYDYYYPNYDYYITKNDSDRSVSMSVSLS